MSVWKPVLAVLLVFVAGLVVGVEGTRIIEQWHERQDARHPQAFNAGLTRGQRYWKLPGNSASVRCSASG